MSHPIDSWWQAFTEQAPRLDALFDRREEWDLPAWMEEHLGAIDPRLMWEFGRAVETEGHRLVITPESNRDLRPLVRAILTRAPALDGWEFYAYRLAEDVETAGLTCEARCGISIEGVTCQVRPGMLGFIELRFVGGEFDEEVDEHFHAGYVAAESLLGEETLDRWIGTIDVGATADPEFGEPVPLAELARQVAAVREEIVAELPEEPWHRRDMDGNWSAIELQPDEAEEYAQMEDLIAFITPAPAVLENVFRGLPFDSVRHSRHGERFCYLKIDGRTGLDETLWDDRGEIEEAIDDVIRESCLGSTVGGGTGLMYSYIELALTDVARAWSAIRDVLRRGGLPNRTWLLFHDSDDETLWRGLYDDTPPPPRPPEDAE